LHKFLIKNFNVQVIVGNLVDIELITLNKNFFNILGIDILLESNLNYFNSDLVNDFLTIPLELNDIRIILLVSLNLRLEIPILNSKLLRKKDNITFFSIGINGFYYSNVIKHLGNSVNDIVNFIKGKTLLNKELYFLSFGYNIFNNHKIKPIGLQVLIGQSFYLIRNSFYLFKVLQNYIAKYCKFS
jgi:hypothetical protein